MPVSQGDKPSLFPGALRAVRGPVPGGEGTEDDQIAQANEAKFLPPDAFCSSNCSA